MLQQSIVLFTKELFASPKAVFFNLWVATPKGVAKPYSGGRQLKEKVEVLTQQKHNFNEKDMLVYFSLIYQIVVLFLKH